MKSIFISLVSLSLLISSHTAMASDPHGKHGKSGDLQAPATMSEIFSEVDKRLATLDRTVEKGDLHRVHQIAFETRDLLLAIPGKKSQEDRTASRSPRQVWRRRKRPNDEGCIKKIQK
jgi:hypothetical protein